MNPAFRSVVPLSALLASAAFAAPSAPASAFENFVTRRGAQIMDGDRPFDYVGWNFTDLLHMRTDLDLVRANRFRLPTCAEIDHGVRAARQAGVKVLRVWGMPNTYDQHGLYNHADNFFWINPDGASVTLNERAMRVHDYLLKVCNEEGVRLMTWFLARVTVDASGKDLAPWHKDLVRQLLNRVNTFTGVAYKDDKAIYAWETGNEINPSPAVTKAFAAYVKSIDRNHLLIDGRHQCTEVFARYVATDALIDDPNIDIVSYHLYWPTSVNGWSATETITKLNERLTAHNKALHVGEISPRESVEGIRKYTDTAINGGVHAILYWEFDGINSLTGGYNAWRGSTWGGVGTGIHWPGFVGDLPGLDEEKVRVDLLVEQGYKRAGQERPPLPAPLRPWLKAISDVGLMRWEPGVGEQWAEVQRSRDGVGGWTTIAPKHVAALYANEALFCDDSAQVGETWFYRVIAHNTAGASQPSNAVGPVAVTHRRLVDSFHDTSKLRERSPETVVHAHYAKDYENHSDFTTLRATADDQHIVYSLGGDVNEVVLLSNGDTKTLAIEGAGADGQYRPLAVKRVVFPPIHQDFSRPRVLLRAADVTASSCRQVRIRFGKDDILSRVEIAYGGKTAPASLQYLVDDADQDVPRTTSWWPSFTEGTGFIGSGYRVQEGDKPAPKIFAIGGTFAWLNPLTPERAGLYDVSVRWPQRANAPAAATYTVIHDGGTVESPAIRLDQTENGGVWTSLGVYAFAGAPEEGVRLHAHALPRPAADAVLYRSVLAYDDFSNGVTAWKTFGGAWESTKSGAFAQTSRKGEAKALLQAGAVWRDYRANVDVRVDPGAAKGTSAGLLFRVVDERNYYALAYHAAERRVRLTKYVDGKPTELAASAPLPEKAGGWRALRVEVEGTGIRGYVDDGKLIEVLDAAAPHRTGGVGLGSALGAAQFDNVRVDPL